MFSVNRKLSSWNPVTYEILINLTNILWWTIIRISKNFEEKKIVWERKNSFTGFLNNISVWNWILCLQSPEWNAEIFLMQSQMLVYNYEQLNWMRYLKILQNNATTRFVLNSHTINVKSIVRQMFWFIVAPQLTSPRLTSIALGGGGGKSLIKMYFEIFLKLLVPKRENFLQQTHDNDKLKNKW